MIGDNTDPVGVAAGAVALPRNRVVRPMHALQTGWRRDRPTACEGCGRRGHARRSGRDQGAAGNGRRWRAVQPRLATASSRRQPAECVRRAVRVEVPAGRDTGRGAPHRRARRHRRAGCHRRRRRSPASSQTGPTTTSTAERPRSSASPTIAQRKRSTTWKSPDGRRPQPATNP